MNKQKPNAMLIELVIVILFFSLSAGIILQLYVAAGDRTLQDATDSFATLYAEDFAERFAASDAAAEAFFLADGWSAAGDAYTKDIEAQNGRTLGMTADVSTVESEAGVLDSMTLTLHDGEREAIAIPVNRYMPKEAVHE